MLIRVLDLVPVVFPRGEGGIYTVFALWADDSTDKKRPDMPPTDRIIAAGSFFGWAASFPSIEDKWSTRLKRAGIEYFRASEVESLTGQFDPVRLGLSLNSARAFADSMRRDLAQIIADSRGIAGIAVGMPIDEFNEVVSSNPKAEAYFGTDAARYMYVILIKQTIQLINEDFDDSKGIPIAFTFDTHTKWKEAEEAYQSMKAVPEFSERMGYVGHADDKTHAPLQMADLMAHEARHRTKAFIAGDTKYRTIFDVLAAQNAVYFCGLLRKQDLINEMGDFYAKTKL